MKLSILGFATLFLLIPNTFASSAQQIALQKTITVTNTLYMGSIADLGLTAEQQLFDEAVRVCGGRSKLLSVNRVIINTDSSNFNTAQSVPAHGSNGGHVNNGLVVLSYPTFQARADITCN